MPWGLNDKWQTATGTGSMNMYSVAIYLDSNCHTKIVYALYYWQELEKNKTILLLSTNVKRPE